MHRFHEFLVARLIAGLLVVAPIYLGFLLLLKAMKSLTGLVKPFTWMLPKSWPAVNILSLLLVLVMCFLVGVLVQTHAGRAAWERLDHSLFQRIPGYALIQGFTRQLAGKTSSEEWKPALVELNDSLMPGFIIEELNDGRVTVFVPSVPTPLAGGVYILAANRVHPLDVPFTHAMKTISKWGMGSKELVAAMERKRTS